MKSKIIKNNSGISLLEVIVAMTIITVSLIGVLSLVIQNIKAQYVNKNVLIASGLAGEGLELVRNSRDLNWLNNGSWKQGLVGDGTYTIDYGGANSIKMSANSIDQTKARLYVDSNGFYTHTSSGNLATNFYRLITVNDQGEYLDVTCAVRWKEGARNHDYTAETYLYNWR